MDRIWTLYDPAPKSYLERFAHFPKAIAQLLYNRQLTDEAQVEAFFARKVIDDNPFHMRGMFEAVKRIREAIQRGEKILVHGDYDADGVTSTAVMVTGLHALGARVAPYIPDRKEGYGLNPNTVSKLKPNGISLMITVDCGISAKAEIELANQSGVDVIVTDHHHLPKELPDAVAIVNPHQLDCSYPDKHLAGVGLAWKTIQALWLAERKSPTGKRRKDLNPNDLLDLVALGTVADVAPLTGENRSLVWRGLNKLRQTKHPGLIALMQSAGVHPQAANAESIAFFLGPRLNAAGRLDHAKHAYYLLRTDKLDQAYQLADELELKNRTRQKLTADALSRAYKKLSRTDVPLLMVSDPDCPKGIVGLVAGRLLEEFYRPSIVLCEGKEFSTASCRSIPEFHIKKALDEVSSLLERYGGHPAAAGFTVRTERIGELNEALLELAGKQLNEDIGMGKLQPKIKADGNLKLEEIDEALVDAIQQLAPFGEQNREPVWIARRVKVVEAKQVGRNQAHLKLTVMDQNNRRWPAIAFRLGPRYAELKLTSIIDIAFSVKRKEWRGRKQLELQLTDFQIPTEQTS